MQQFKVNDWVRVKTDTFEYDGTARISKGVKRLSKFDMWLFSENHYKCNPNKYIEHWQPKVGEWCWYKHLLVKVLNIDKREDGIINYKVSAPMYAEQYSGAISLEPFIGGLPSSLKETK